MTDTKLNYFARWLHHTIVTRWSGVPGWFSVTDDFGNVTRVDLHRAAYSLT